MRAVLRPPLSALFSSLLVLGCGTSGGPAIDASGPEAGGDAPVSDGAAAADQGGAMADGSVDLTRGGGDALDAAPAAADAVAADGESADACAEALSAAQSAAYFPFMVGARWMFRGTGTSNGIPIGPRLSRREVTGTKSFGTATAAVVFGPEHDLDPKTLEDYLEVTADGLVDHGSSEPAVLYERAGRYVAPFIAVPFPLRTCGPYEPFNRSVKIDDRDGDGMPETLTARATTTFSFEDVTVSAGAFQKVLRVESVEELSLTNSKPPSAMVRQSQRRTIDWYAANIGPIKRYVEREGVKTTAELIAYSVGDARRGVVPIGLVARDVDEASNNPYTPNRPAIGYDGKQFLVVVPTSKVGLASGYGNLKAVVVDREGKPVSSGMLLDNSSELQKVSIAWDGTRYLVVYHNAGYGRVEMLTVSAAGQTINGPIVLEEERAIPSVVATKDGFLVSYTKYTPEPGTLKPIGHVWLAAVDGQGHPTSRVQPYPASPQWTATLAQDGAGGILSLFYTPPATPSPTSPETANILAAGRVTADGHAIDAAPFAVDAVPKVGHDDAQLVFDGTNFVAQWSERVDSSTVQMRLARISPMGTLLDGPATSGGITVGGGGSPRLAPFSGGSLIVWGFRSASDFFTQGLGGTRLGTDGKLLDLPGDGGGRWFLSDYGAMASSLFEIRGAGDRALVVWANRASSQKNVFDVGCALAYPW